MISCFLMADLTWRQVITETVSWEVHSQNVTTSTRQSGAQIEKGVTVVKPTMDSYHSMEHSFVSLWFSPLLDKMTRLIKTIWL